MNLLNERQRREKTKIVEKIKYALISNDVESDCEAFLKQIPETYKLSCFTNKSDIRKIAKLENIASDL